MRRANATPALMIQGTGSDTGKSLLVAGLARAFANRGLSVRPFKPQNMSNNAAVTQDGGEIGRAQALQARAAGVAASKHMNPVLLKPQTEVGAQVVVQGQVIGNAGALDYQSLKPKLLPQVLDSFDLLSREADLVLVEGAGSAAEINLRASDIANMGFALAANVPVLLAGDIDRGGVIAQIVGTHALLSDAERALVKGFMINKFRGDARLFESGMTEIAKRTGWQALGLIPWFAQAKFLPAEDAMGLDQLGGKDQKGKIVIAVPKLPRLSNFDDFDPLLAEPEVSLIFVEPGQPIPASADWILLGGSKATRADLAFLFEQGWDIDIKAHLRRQKPVLGLCGGYQMLGRKVCDPLGLEGEPGDSQGLGLLEIDTEMTPDKITREVTGTARVNDEIVTGYEIHMGRSHGPDGDRPMLDLPHGPDGAVSKDGLVMGCYLHGLFQANGFRRRFLNLSSTLDHSVLIESTLDKLALHLAAHLDLDLLLTIARERSGSVARP
ncbi:Cobyric acid synthase [Rhodospirillaceae bacterium LM-1]|nr:Cobyric acid synthase [Rhodospirillaceae bacterium LM-1]